MTDLRDRIEAALESYKREGGGNLLAFLLAEVLAGMPKDSTDSQLEIAERELLDSAAIDANHMPKAGATFTPEAHAVIEHLRYLRCERQADVVDALARDLAEAQDALQQIAEHDCGCRPCHCADSLGFLQTWRDGVRELARAALARLKAEHVPSVPTIPMCDAGCASEPELELWLDQVASIWSAMYDAARAERATEEPKG